MTTDASKDKTKIAGLVLAAGESSRMGRDKALLDYRGRTFLETIVSTLLEAGLHRIVVVLGHHAEQIQRAVRLGPAEVVINSDFGRGQTSSLQAGLAALERDGPDAVVLCLVDQPTLSAATVRTLIQTFRQPSSAVVIPTFQSQRGHPVLISRALFKELKDLPPDHGANEVIRKYDGKTQFVGVDDPGILNDVDDPDSYRNLQRGT